MSKPDARKIVVGDVAMPMADHAIAGTGILGIKKSGKTTVAKGIAEQYLDAGVPIIVFDAIGVWRWLSVPGSGPGAKGYPVVVAGGKKPDLPLTVDSAPSIVRAAMRENVNLIIDLYDPKLSKADWRRIVEDCFTVLLYENERVRHIFLEEAAEYVPQTVGSNGKVYAAVEKLVRMGGNAGLGITLINPRTQEINKAVLELCDNVILLRQRGSNAIDAVQKWMDRASPDIAKEIASSLSTMKAGECWVWTEENDEPIFTRSKLTRSFHPDRRDHGIQATAAKPVDAGAFVTRLSGELEQVIAKAKEDDPATLKQRIKELERQANKKEGKPVVDKALAEEVRQLTATRQADAKVIEQLRDTLSGIGTLAQRIIEACGVVHKTIDKKVPEPDPRIERREERRIPTPPIPEPQANGFKLSSTQQRILNALAWYESIGNHEPTLVQLGAIALIDTTGGHFSNVCGPLSSNGLVSRSPGRICLTDAGRRYAEVPERVGSLDDYHDVLRARVLKVKSAGKRTVDVLNAVIDGGGREVTCEEIGQKVGIDHTGGHFSNTIGPLSTLGLIERNQGRVKPTEVLFPEGLS